MHVVVAVIEGEEEELVGSPKRDDIAVDVHDTAELRLAPEFDFGECGDKVGAVDEPEVGWGCCVGDWGDCDEGVVDGLRGWGD